MDNMTEGYQPIPGAYSEMVAPDGAIRPHWLPMLEQLGTYGVERVSSRWKRAQRVIRQNGITYRAFGDPKSGSRPWKLDPVPLVISPDEWAGLSAGLIQRMELLNRLLHDVYGEQQLLKNRILPSELVLANRAFHRSCTQIRPPDKHYLTMLAVDLARAPNGEWRVVKDRTQAPSGAGYALANRLVVSRTFPTMYRDSHVERLAVFFAALRDRLTELSPRQNVAPRIVILTPGTRSESYFEHAYLSRYLGFPLVQGNDLTVRGNQVFLKTLGGLRQVDVILRRQNDSDCDSLELDSTSSLGVPGLVQAAAAGEVVVANALGSGLAETPALLPFLPMLCRTLLDEKPLLATVPTLWCGQTAEMNQVLDTLDRWVIKQAFRGNHAKPVFPQQLSAPERTRLIDEIRENPKRFIAQENTALGGTPCWQGNRMVSRRVLLRTFVVATGDGWSVMPGGLARTFSKGGSAVATLSHRGGSKDAWVVAKGEVSRLSLLSREGNEFPLSRGEDNLSSRVADNLFWLGRYIERAELQTRILRTILRYLTEETFPDGNPELPELLRTLSVLTGLHPAGNPILDPVSEMERTAEYIAEVIFNQNHTGNLYHGLTQASRIGTMMRDRISMDAWRILDRLDLKHYGTDRNGELTDVQDMLDDLLMPLSAFSGLGFESMAHDYGWLFMDMGFRLERAGMSIRILSELLIAPGSYEAPVLDAVLEVSSSSITYHTRYPGTVAILPLLDLLIADATNPRSIAFQLHLLDEHIRRLSSLPRTEPQHEQVLATDLLKFVEGTDLSPLIDVGPDGRRSRLSSFLGDIDARLHQLSDMITERYLAHVETTHSLSSLVSGKQTITEIL
jgi:uncharacterized circularly permuted ATP-grasp superfamily protein/uncharacterized alpha-E superfamily protein